MTVTDCNSKSKVIRVTVTDYDKIMEYCNNCNKSPSEIVTELLELLQKSLKLNLLLQEKVE